MIKDHIEWIFFDLGETLIDESAPISDSIRQFTEQAELLGYKYRSEQVQAALQEAYRHYAEHPMWSVMEAWIPSEEHRAKIKKGMTYHKHMERPFPSSLALLQTLSRRYRIGIIANQGPGTPTRLEAYGFSPYISVCCASAEAGMAKPDPQFFLMALDQAQCRPEHAVMIGDRLDNDVIPAKRLGMSAIWVRQGDARFQPLPARSEAPDAICDSIEQIAALFT
ncbi:MULTISPECIES: HAD family hydrolase [unclassified Paenibacillus]|uniref:HAD family hydrolase n=1 Tax=unclassified Paenibacillus TaxID=185978 RepID=UPI001AE62139|nr:MULTISPECIES: HAD family hydrolase [unclassified Paenibacillus]MBP1154309.1 HAD superfamily hydrolase (TIGR01549 family) [Paenibacillus sp. PvP091]MBP1170307.1 HAD superfamily hydrolase (TIGR01549 family) [Paenibacillus sp. PvR098]MBP2441335.1 HAD superfamily hydrolase (TIGR01549 family) [Paenibacillus sp. PvP052]